MNNLHPYIRYGVALLETNQNKDFCDIESQNLIDAIESGLNHFRMEPASSLVNDTVTFTYTKKEKGDTQKGIFLSSHVVGTDKLAGNLWKTSIELQKNLRSKPLTSNEGISMSMLPVCGEYLLFGNAGKPAGRGKSKASLKEAATSIITTLTPHKPAFYFDKDYYCIIPDLPLESMRKFIALFQKIQHQNNTNDLFIGKVDKNKPKRPYLYRGNFPYAPKSMILGGVGLIAAMGEFVRQEEISLLAREVLEALKLSNLYLIKYGNATPFSINHHIIDLAKNSRLKTVIDGLYYAKLYSEDFRSYNNVEYQKFDLMTNRFLQLFSKPAFKDFLSFRAEYPKETEILFNTYFSKMEKINQDIIQSAKSYGKWLNTVAYWAAKNSLPENAGKEDIRQAKAKALIEFESTAFSAKTGTGLISQTVTKAGRLSYSEAPKDAEMFFDAVTSGDLELDTAKNLIIAYSRIRSVESQKMEDSAEENQQEENNTEFNDI